MSEVRIIKRYANRKLYDTQHSRYVTLDQIAEMIREGDDVKIIDNRSKDDLTSVTLAQIIFEEEKKQKSFLPLQAMRNIIQSGGDSITHLVSQAQRRVNEILPHKRDGDDELDEGTALTEADGRGGPLAIREFREFVQSSQRTIDEWQRKIDGRIQAVVEGISPLAGLHSDVRNLQGRIAELEAKLAEVVERDQRASGGSLSEGPSSDASGS